MVTVEMQGRAIEEFVEIVNVQPAFLELVY